MSPAATVRVRLGGGGHDGRAVDLAGTEAPPPDELVAAVRDEDDGRVRCPTPGPVHEHVGLVGGRAGALARRHAMAAVARSRGHRAPNREQVETLADRLGALDPPAATLTAARERVAEAGADVTERREHVASLRGRVRALREAGEEAAATAAGADLADAAAALSEAETERAAAEQALERARRRAREARDARERRLELEDRVANERRESRAALADAVRERVDAAVVAVPGTSATRLADADPVTARLALARVARLDAPVVLAARRFLDAAAAVGWLDAPVLRA
jgi:hypothetical protein